MTVELGEVACIAAAGAANGVFAWALNRYLNGKIEKPKKKKSAYVSKYQPLTQADFDAIKNGEPLPPRPQLSQTPPSANPLFALKPR